MKLHSDFVVANVASTRRLGLMPEVKLLDTSAKGPHHAHNASHRIGSNDLAEGIIADNTEKWSVIRRVFVLIPLKTVKNMPIRVLHVKGIQVPDSKSMGSAASEPPKRTESGICIAE